MNGNSTKHDSNLHIWAVRIMATCRAPPISRIVPFLFMTKKLRGKIKKAKQLKEEKNALSFINKSQLILSGIMLNIKFIDLAMTVLLILLKLKK